MKYKLKINCPKYKAGEMFHISQKGNLVHTDSGQLAYSKKDLEEYPTILGDWFVETLEEPKTVGDLKEGDKCYRAWLEGAYTKIMPELWKDTLEQRHAREYNNIFLTLDDAVRSVQRDRAQAILQRDTKGFKPDWSNGNQAKYLVYYGYECTTLTVRSVYWRKYGNIHFATREDASRFH